jgi:hypothetical protein
MPTKRSEADKEHGAPAMPIAAFETAIDTQAAFIGEVDRLSQLWIRRRMEAVEQVRRIVEELKGASDPSSILVAQQTWLSGAMTRLMSDLSDLSSFALNCLNRTGDSVVAATRKGQEAGYEGLARAGAKPGAAEPWTTDNPEQPGPAVTD